MFCLEIATDPSWAKEAVRSFDRVLVDHAHCELKAASNATSLLARFPGIPNVARALSELAREELEHFERVLDFLAKREVSLPPPEIDTYAKELRGSVARLPSPGQMPLVDRLLVGALIEARSCERFKLLVDALEATTDDPELLVFYRELFECEARHYRTYVDLAIDVAGSRPLVQDRLTRLAGFEREIIERLAEKGDRATVHG